jgi:5-formyltetrahydrofolate cyclo-ligase
VARHFTRRIITLVITVTPAKAGDQLSKLVGSFKPYPCLLRDDDLEIEEFKVVDLLATKKQARAAATAIRKIAHAAQHETAPLQLASGAFPVQPTATCKIISGFYPYQSEIDTRPLLGRLAGEGWTTCLPIVLGDGLPLEFRRWAPGAPTIKGVWGIPRPPEDAELVEPDVLIIPLLSFDRKGFRLGYGGGFYDRTLEMLRARKNIIAIGVGYSAQEVDHVPVGENDQPLDYVITEKELILINA